MVQEDKEYKPKAINYRRIVNSWLWEWLMTMCLQDKMKPNDFIDCLIIAEWNRRKSNG